jgi:hypothetical protein
LANNSKNSLNNLLKLLKISVKQITESITNTGARGGAVG